MKYILSILTITVLLLLGIASVQAQTSGTAEQLRSIFIQSSCIRTCFMGLEPGRTTQAQVRSYFVTQNITYSVYAGIQGNDEPNGIYDWIFDSNTPLTPSTTVPSSIGFDDGIISRIDLMLLAPLSVVYEAFGYPDVTLTDGDPDFFYLVYTSHNLVFQVARIAGLEQVSRVTLYTPQLLALIHFSGIDTPVTAANCSQVPSEICNIPRLTSSGTGLRGAYFDNADFTALRYFRLNPTINFNWAAGSPDPALGVDTFSVRWSGRIEPLYSESYTFFVTHNDGTRLWVNGQQIINNWTNRTTSVTSSGTITLAGGARYDIRLDYFDNTGAAEVRLEWQSTSQAREVIPASQLYSTETNQLSVED
jgi:hypothetical protein